MDVPDHHSLTSKSRLRFYTSTRRPGASLGTVVPRPRRHDGIYCILPPLCFSYSCLFCAFGCISSLRTGRPATMNSNIMLKDIKRGSLVLSESWSVSSSSLCTKAVQASHRRRLVISGLAATSLAPAVQPQKEADLSIGLCGSTEALRRRFMRVPSRGVEHAGNGGPLWDFCI